MTIQNSISKSVLLYSFNLNNVRYRSLFFQSTCLGRVAGAKKKAKLSLQARQIAARAYSTSSKDGSCFALALFSDADKDKLYILKYVKGKAGISLCCDCKASLIK